MSRDHRRDRSPEAKGYNWLYKLDIWRGKGGIRARELRKHPICMSCMRRGKVVTATIVHHLEPHKGDYRKFVDGPFESVCASCHDGPIQSQEARGLRYSREVDTSTGYPISKGHPFNG